VRSFLRECRSLVRLLRAPRERRDIIFYAEHEGYWPSFEGLVDDLTRDRGQPLTYITSAPDDPIFENHHDLVDPYYLKHLLPYFMVFVDCRVFVMTLTELGKYHLKRSVNDVHYVYVFHSLVSTHMMYTASAFDGYDAIFCVGPHHVREFTAMMDGGHMPRRTLVEAGYYRLERVHEAAMAVRQGEGAGVVRTILIAPSWGADNILARCGERLIDLLLTAGYRVVMRPHPETVRREGELVRRLQARFQGNERFVSETTVIGDENIVGADVLICDCSGVALEYALGVERPVLFIDLPVKVKNAEYRNLGMEPLELLVRPDIGVIVPPDDVESIPAVVERLIAERDTFTARCAALRDQVVFNFGSSSAVGADYLARRLRGDAHGTTE